MIKNIEIENFKNFKKLNLELNPLNVLIGANGTGKSNFLNHFLIYKNSANSSLLKFINEYGGFKGLSTDFKIENGTKLEIEFTQKFYTIKDPPGFKIHDLKKTDVKFNIFKYYLDFFNHRSQYILNETFRNNSNLIFSTFESFIEIENIKYKLEASEDVNKPRFNMDGESITYKKTDEPKLPMFVSNETSIYDAVNYFQNFKLYKDFDLGINSQIRKPQIVKFEYTLDKTGSNLVNVLHTITNNSFENWEKIESILKACFRNYEKLVFSPSIGDGQIDMKIKFKHIKAPISTIFLSEGQLKLLCILSILYSPSIEMELVLLDEPELYLHPSLHRIIGEAIKEVSENKQLLVATHSPELLNALEPKDILTLNFNKEDGSTNIERLSSREDLFGWLEDYKLGELWEMGEIGGRD